MGFVHFKDPYGKNTLEIDQDECLYDRTGGTLHSYKNQNGIYDFVLEGSDLWKEREYYDREYSIEKKYNITLESLKYEWFAKIMPWRKTYLERLGEIRKKKILLLGNGESYKELYFLTLGAKVVFTDLSMEAVKRIKTEFEKSFLFNEYQNNIEFHAVDALNLPFCDAEFDIIYGSAFAHHLESLELFLSEVYRCLKKNGICRFIDQAESKLWKLLINIFYPMKMLSYWLQPRSPEDIKANEREGYNIEVMSKLKKRIGFREMLFHREWFFLHIVTRHCGKLVKWNPTAIKYMRGLYLLAKGLDNILANTKWMKQNNLWLIWGFTK